MSLSGPGCPSRIKKGEKAGLRCGRDPIEGSKYCGLHDPKLARSRARAARKGARIQAKRRGLDPDKGHPPPQGDEEKLPPPPKKLLKAVEAAAFATSKKELLPIVAATQRALLANEIGVRTAQQLEQMVKLQIELLEDDGGNVDPHELAQQLLGEAVPEPEPIEAGEPEVD